MSDKTEAPTARRLERAWREGDVPVSTALLQAGGLGAAVLLIPTAARSVAERFSELWRLALQSPERVGGEVLLEAVRLSLPVLGLSCVAIVALGVVQTRGVFAPARVKLDFSRLLSSPVRALFSSQRGFALLRALVTSVLVALLVARRISEHLPELGRSAGQLEGAAQLVAVLAPQVGRDAVLILLALAAADVIVTHRSWWSRLKMSREEVKRDHREAEGDPALKAAREQAHHELLASAAITAVKSATVVVVNPTHLANALRYDQEHDEAPVLVAKGEGLLAQRIVEAAHAYGIPVVQDVPLARALAELSEGDAIPPELYEAVALILREVWDQQQGPGAEGPEQ